MFVAIIVFVIVVASVSGFALFKINTDYVSGIDVLNANGSETVLVIYHPGISSFMKDVIYAFADGLVENGWRVEITTASSQTPTAMSNYSLLVLGSPIYAGSPSPTIKRHISRIGDLQEIDTVIIFTSGGVQESSVMPLKQAIEEHNGTFETFLSLFTGASNEGDGDPLDIAEQAGRETFP